MGGKDFLNLRWPPVKCVAPDNTYHPRKHLNTCGPICSPDRFLLLFLWTPPLDQLSQGHQTDSASSSGPVKLKLCFIFLLRIDFHFWSKVSCIPFVVLPKIPLNWSSCLRLCYRDCRCALLQTLILGAGMTTSCVLASAHSAEPQLQAQVCLKVAISLGVFVFNSLIFFFIWLGVDNWKGKATLAPRTVVWVSDSNIFGEKATTSLIPWDKR